MGTALACTSPQEGCEHPSISNGHDEVQHKTMTQTAVSREDRTLSVPTHSSNLVLKKRHLKKTVVLYHAHKLAQCSLLKMLKR